MSSQNSDTQIESTVKSTPMVGGQSRRDFLRIGGMGAAATLLAASQAGATEAVKGGTGQPVTKETCLEVYKKLEGPLLPILPAFADNGDLDLASTCKWVQWLLDSGVKLFWTTYGTSHYPYLTDDEIYALNRAVAEVTKGKAVFIASTSFNWSIPACLNFADQVKQWGGSAVKAQLDWRWNPSDDNLFDFYHGIAEKSALPLFAYSVTNPPKKGISDKLLLRILTMPQFIGLKNDAGDFYEQCAYLRRIRKEGVPFEVMTGGSMVSFLNGYDFGQRAFATGVGMVFPKVSQAFYEALVGGKRDVAVKIVKDIEEPFTELMTQISVTHWACYHTMLKELGFFKSDYMRLPLGTSNAEDRKTIAKFMESQVWKDAEAI